MNVPDTISYGDLIGEEYGAKLFFKEHRNTRVGYLRSKIKEIVSSDIVVTNNSDMHPTHKLCYLLTKNINTENNITYHIQHTFKPSETQMPGIYEQTIARLETFGAYLNIVVLTPEEYEKKQKEFQISYVSQYEDFQKSGLKFYPHEMYLSSEKLNLETK